MGVSRADLFRVSKRRLRDCSLEFCSDLAESLGRDDYSSIFRSGDWNRVLDLPFDTSCVEGVLLSSILSKAAPDQTGVAPESLRKIALSKFTENENVCGETNQRMAKAYSKLGYAEADPLLQRIRSKIATCLGHFNWNMAYPHFAFGPGATTHLGRAKADRYYKYGENPVTTSCLYPLAEFTISQSPVWKQTYRRLDICDANKVTTVPKNAKTDRVIAIEPSMNMYIQKGLGRLIRNRLLRVGVDLNDQSINQNLSYQASVDGSLSTIDLSAASDTISRRVVELFLPPDWFHALNMCRSQFGSSESGRFYYQKFSSMGNGFTFELESLIFWAICSACIEVMDLSDHRLGIYGDDLIVPTASFDLIEYTLNWYGFTLNRKKSYNMGSFRESCGKAWISGNDVTPFYIRESIEGITSCYLLLNNFRRWVYRVYGLIFPPRLWLVYEKWLKLLVPEKFQQFRIPDGYGDLGLVSSFVEALPQRDRNQWEGWWTKQLAHVPLPEAVRKSRRVDGPSLLPKALASIESTPIQEIPGSFVMPRKSEGGYSDELPYLSGVLRLQISKLFVAQWRDTSIPLV